jgi:glyoxylase I family protein
MGIHMKNVGIAVRDLEEAIAFFTDLGLIVLGTDTVQGQWARRGAGLQPSSGPSRVARSVRICT